MTCSEAAKLGHEKRREIIRLKACELRSSLGLPPHPGLALVLTNADRINFATANRA